MTSSLALQRHINATRRARDRAFQSLREIAAAAAPSVAETAQPAAGRPGTARPPNSFHLAHLRAANRHHVGNRRRPHTKSRNKAISTP